MQTAQHCHLIISQHVFYLEVKKNNQSKLTHYVLWFVHLRRFSIQRNEYYEEHLFLCTFTVNPSFSHGQVTPSLVSTSIHDDTGNFWGLQVIVIRYVSFNYESMKTLQSSVRAATTFGLQVACLSFYYSIMSRGKPKRCRSPPTPRSQHR